MKENEERVNSPSHYNQGKIEVIDFIEDQNLNFHRGNAIKYICRAGIKDQRKEVEDLKKAIWYIEREIKRIGGGPENAKQPVEGFHYDSISSDTTPGPSSPWNRIGG